uniref:Reverse transcriptase zinc-binding domain-containing protein n=1 Tax=Trichogramma kaykai TaxID=54128 RepID=A0ABD2XI03_9HYME
MIPNVRSWIERRHGEVNHDLNQLQTGHGYFKHHSQRYDLHNASADCPVCPNTVENAEHVFFNCIRFEEGREKLHRQLQEVAKPENIVQLMLADEKNWLVVATFAHSVITSLRAEEMARRR